MRLPSFLTTIGAAAFLLIATPASAAKYPGALDINGPSNVYPGQVAIYTVEATNIAGDTLPATVTTFHFDPSVMEFLPDQSTPGCSVTNTGYADCILGDLGTDEAVQIQFAFRIKDSAQCNSKIAVDVDFKAADGLLVDWVMWDLKVECKNKYKCGNVKVKVKQILFYKKHKTHFVYKYVAKWKHHKFKYVIKKKFKFIWDLPNNNGSIKSKYHYNGNGALYNYDYNWNVGNTSYNYNYNWGWKW